MVFITTNPLSELVWSPHKGLSIKYANSNVAETKASLLWNTESFNIMILPQQCPGLGDSSKTSDLAEGNSNLIQLKPNSDSKSSKKVTGSSPPQSLTGMQPFSQSTLHGQHSRLGVGMEFLNRTNGFPGNELKEDNISSPAINETNAFKFSPETEVVENNRSFMSGPGNYLNLEDPESHSAHAEAGITLNTQYCDYLGSTVKLNTSNTMELEERLPNTYCISESDETLVKQPPTSRTVDGGQAIATVDDVGDVTNIMATQKLQSFHSSGGQCSLGGVQLKKDNGVAAASEALEKDEPGIRQGYPIEISSPLEALSISTCKHLNIVKTKENVISDAENSSPIAKERADSNDSVESCNSKKLISMGKRAWVFEPEASTGSKRHKSNEDCCSGSLRRQDSSFMNWISTMTNGFYRSNAATHFSALLPEMSHKRTINDTSMPNLVNKSKDFVSSSMGFRSMFQALYCSSWRLHENAPEDINHQKEPDSQKELVPGEEVSCVNRFLHAGGIDVAAIHDAVPITAKEASSVLEDDQVAGELFSAGRVHIVSDGEDVQLNNQIPVGNERSKQSSFQVEELASGGVHLSTVDLSINSKQKNCIKDGYSLTCIELPNSSFQNGPLFPSEGKTTGMLTSVQNSNRSGFLESLWITRLFPKGSAPMSKSQQCNQTIDAPIVRFINDSDNYHHFPSNDTRDIACEGTQEHFAFPGDLCTSKRTDDDQKFTSKLSPILPSERVKKAEPMASVFAKRLDALKHIVSPKASTDANSAPRTCFSCGKIGHSLRDCSDLAEPEYVDLAKKLKSYDSTKNTDKSSPSCTSGFELKQWAIACPRVLLNRRHTDESKVIVRTENCERPDERDRYYCSNSSDRKIILCSGNKVEQGELVHEDEISERRKSTMKELVTGDAACTSVKPFEAGFQVQPRMANQPSCSSENLKSKENQIIPLCNIATAKVTDWPADIFEMMKQLQLSRTVIIRLAKSPFFKFILDGFFLRVRLGKWEEGLGGTGYNVARINGVSCENSFSVNIGSFHCMVDCRFVSNREFLEDELKAWWVTSTSGDGKPPSREDLKKKISERMKFGF